MERTVSDARWGAVSGIVIAVLAFAPLAYAAVSTDKDDYSPGETVTISGDGYWAGESISVEVTTPYGNESGAALADSNGEFSWSFVLPSDDSALGDYSYMVTGDESGIVQSGVFSDGNVKAFPLPTSVTFSLTLTIYDNTTCSGNITSGPTVEAGVSDPSGETTGVGNTESVLMQAAALSDQGTAFIEWTTADPFVATSTTIVAGDTICVQGFTAGGDRDYFANYGAPPTTGTLTLLKTVVKDNGGTALDTNWILSAAGPTPISGVEGNASITNAVVDPGAYTLSESTGPLGYSPSAWVCAGGNQTDDDTVTIVAGDDVTCTITNDDIQPLLTVTKTVMNDNGGTLGVGDFPLFVDATPVVSGVQNGFDAGAYTVSETEQGGYTASTWGGDCDPDGSITLSLGGVYECTITNDDQQGTLIVQKVLINDDGGVTATSTFAFQVDGGGSQNFEADGENELAVNAGSYSVVEDAAPGYTTTYANSENGDIDCDNLFVGNGETVTCTITNDDEPPTTATLTLLKEVFNDNGGTASDTDWTLEASGPTPISGAEGDASITNAEVSPGSYDLSETGGPTGYDPSAWVCQGTGTQDDADTITLVAGEELTCTIENDDQPGTLIVQKVLINDDGGVTATSTFAFQVDGGGSQNFEADGENELTVDAGSYNVVEDAAPGYTTTYANSENGDIDCDNLFVGNGETVTCTITNDDEAAEPPPACECCNSGTSTPAVAITSGIFISVANSGCITSSTSASASTGGNSAEGSRGGRGGRGGEVEANATLGNSTGNNGGSSAGDGGDGGAGGAGGTVISGPANATAESRNVLNRVRIRLDLSGINFSP